MDYNFLHCSSSKGALIDLYQLLRLIKGAVLIVTLTLIGTGWAFIKYVLSEKEKRLFIIVIPIQILVNIAYIIHYEAEEGTKEWNQIEIYICKTVSSPDLNPI